ncbi:hypothetical protein [Ectobacillus panaciterrae]|uniref:hypothetical protein n=1 Tax=Ectobacillus panaciterrae TaxID=363872 RepID=UPI000402FFE5|nr:hypothetical protein [Ectobacillus panaciterrae]
MSIAANIIVLGFAGAIFFAIKKSMKPKYGEVPNAMEIHSVHGLSGLVRHLESNSPIYMEQVRTRVEAEQLDDHNERIALFLYYSNNEYKDYGKYAAGSPHSSCSSCFSCSSDHGGCSSGGDGGSSGCGGGD